MMAMIAVLQRSGCLGGTRAIMKQSLKYLPVIGWSMYFSEYVFLARNWAKDETTLKAGYRNLQGFPRPFWLALFVEGTRFTQTKLAAAQEYAASVGMPVPRNVLIPRTKGFVSAITNLRDFVPAVYDITIAISNEAPEPNMSRILKGLPSVVHLRVKRVPMEELPTTDEGIAQWCRDAFVRKDDELDEHKKTNSFEEELYQPFPRMRGPLLVCIRMFT
jgi:lysophosphatidic acid acyltransferase/lysophosphatidylinositol acyltransferase